MKDDSAHWKYWYGSARSEPSRLKGTCFVAYITAATQGELLTSVAVKVAVKTGCTVQW
jgi:hypothetical protein